MVQVSIMSAVVLASTVILVKSFIIHVLYPFLKDLSDDEL